MSISTVNIFVSSTWLDLQPEREAVEKALQRMRETKFVGMEYFGSRAENTRRASLDEVKRSHVYVGIIGGRYGSGITEAEYRQAQHLPCFIYCKSEPHILPEGREPDPAQAAKLTALKQELHHRHTVCEFANPHELAAKLTADLHNWLFNEYLSPRLEKAAHGEFPRNEVQALLNGVKDPSALDQDLLTRLRKAGYVIATSDRSVAIGRDAHGNLIITGSNNQVYLLLSEPSAELLGQVQRGELRPEALPGAVPLPTLTLCIGYQDLDTWTLTAEYPEAPPGTWTQAVPWRAQAGFAEALAGFWTLSRRALENDAERQTLTAHAFRLGEALATAWPASVWSSGRLPLLPGIGIRTGERFIIWALWGSRTGRLPCWLTG